MKAYTDGEYLSYEEIEYLAQTSKLLNKCVDKENI